MNNGTKAKRVLLAFTAGISLLSLLNLAPPMIPAAMAANKFELYSTTAERAYGARDYPEAEKNFILALKESDKLEKGDKRPATTLYNLALVYQAEGKYDDAEQTYIKAKDAFAGIYGAEHQKVGQVYLDMADLFVQAAGDSGDAAMRTKAADNYKSAIAIFEKIYAQATGQIAAPAAGEKQGEKKDDAAGTAKTDDAAAPKKDKEQAAPKKSADKEAAENLANAIKSLASFHSEADEFAPAEPLYTRVLELEEFALGPDDKQLAKDKAHVAEFYCVQGKYKPAGPLFREALAISEKANGVDAPETGTIAYNYGGLFYDEGNFAEAEKMFKRGIKILEKTSTDENDVAMKSIALADVLDMQSRPEEAQTVYKKTIASLEKNPDPSGLIACLKSYQKHLLIQNKKEEATKIAARIKELKADMAKQAKSE